MCGCGTGCEPGLTGNQIPKIRFAVIAAALVDGLHQTTSPGFVNRAPALPVSVRRNCGCHASAAPIIEALDLRGIDAPDGRGALWRPFLAVPELGDLQNIATTFSGRLDAEAARSGNP